MNDPPNNQSQSNASTAPTSVDSEITNIIVPELEAMAANRNLINQDYISKIVYGLLSIEFFDANNTEAIARAVLAVLAVDTSMVNCKEMKEICQTYLQPEHPRTANTDADAASNSQVQKALSKAEKREADVAKAVRFICEIPDCLKVIRNASLPTKSENPGHNEKGMESQNTADCNAKIPKVEQSFQETDNDDKCQEQ